MKTRERPNVSVRVRVRVRVRMRVIMKMRVNFSTVVFILFVITVYQMLILFDTAMTNI